MSRATRDMLPPYSLKEMATHYCPGCSHGIVQRLIAEVAEDLNITKRIVGVAPVGCGGWIYRYLNFDFLAGAHGRASAIACGVKHALPGKVVFSYQGDGDLIAIGWSEVFHAAARGELITIIFINNAVYGMTGGQYAPTTLVKQKTTTTPEGRSVEIYGYPIRFTEVMSQLPKVSYVARVAVNSPKNIIKAKKAIKNAFVHQIETKGFSAVEILSTCPTNWGLTPEKSLKWVEENMMAYYALGEFVHD